VPHSDSVLQVTKSVDCILVGPGHTTEQHQPRGVQRSKQGTGCSIPSLPRSGGVKLLRVHYAVHATASLGQQ
jgi:hypothetical protein